MSCRFALYFDKRRSIFIIVIFIIVWNLFRSVSQNVRESGSFSIKGPCWGCECIRKDECDEFECATGRRRYLTLTVLRLQSDNSHGVNLPLIWRAAEVPAGTGLSSEHARRPFYAYHVTGAADHRVEKCERPNCSCSCQLTHQIL